MNNVLTTDSVIVGVDVHKFNHMAVALDCFGQEKDSIKERALSETGVSDLTRQLKDIEEKIDRLLEAYLDKVIEETEYKAKKNELLENKLSLQAQIKEIMEKGNEWLEPFSDFVEKAKTGANMARAKNNLHELAIHAKTVGSNFTLLDRQLTCEYVKQGWKPLFESGVAVLSRPSTRRLLSGVCLDSLQSTRNELYQQNGKLNSISSPSCNDPKLPKCNKDAYALGLSQCGL